VNLPTRQPCPRCGVPQCEYPEGPVEQTCEACGCDFQLTDWRQGDLWRINEVPACRVMVAAGPVHILEAYAARLVAVEPAYRFAIEVGGSVVGEIP